jgi:hypothetical protein
MRPVSLLTSIVIGSVVLVAGALTSRASATTTVDWTGSNNFNDWQITFSPFQANQLTDITGFGQYEACCEKGWTTFTLDLQFDTGWKTILTWKTKGDEKVHLLGDLVPDVIAFSDSLISGIRLTSDPNGKPSSDYNFANFNFGIYLSRDEYYEKYKSKYSSRKEFDNCDDYEQYVRKLTSFVFDLTDSTAESPPPAPTPLPATLPLMGTVLGGFVLARWRRRRRKSI